MWHASTVSRQEYEKSKEITRQRLYIETMESIITPKDGGSVTLVDKKLANYLPIQMLEGVQNECRNE